MYMSPTSEVAMSKQRSLSVNDAVYARFNALKVRIAVSNNNRIPTAPDLIMALIEIGESRYDELLSQLTNEPENET